MSQIVSCPSCQSRYRTAASPGNQLPCPACGTTIVVPSQPTAGFQGGAAFRGGPDFPGGAGAGAVAQPGKGPSPSRSAAPGLAPDLLPFVKRLGIGLGIVAGLLAVGTVIGVFSETAALVTVGFGVLVAVGLALAGKIWVVVIGFGHSPAYGLGCLLVPLFWAVLLANRIGKSQHALALAISALVPAALTMGSLAITAPQHTSAGKSAARRARLSARADQFVETIRRHEQEHPPAAEPTRVVFRCPIRVADPIGFAAEGERLLAQFQQYVPGSLAVHENGTTISFEHRGTHDLHLKYRLYLASKTGVVIGQEVSDAAED